MSLEGLEVKLPEGYNRHHTASPRNAYRTPLERRYRNHDFFVNGVEIKPHSDYHATHQHPLKLTAQQMISTLCFMEELAGEPLQPSERIDEIARYLEGRSVRETKVARNLFQQGLFIAEFGV